MTGLYLANLAPALFLAGIAWYLQIVQLPLLRDSPDFAAYVRAHRFRNTLLMALPMAVELIAAALLWIENHGTISAMLFALVVFIWFATFAGITPEFRRLTRGYEKTAVARLIAWNSVRAACWAARSVVLLYVLSRA